MGLPYIEPKCLFLARSMPFWYSSSSASSTSESQKRLDEAISVPSVFSNESDEAVSVPLVSKNESNEVKVSGSGPQRGLSTSVSPSTSTLETESNTTINFKCSIKERRRRSRKCMMKEVINIPYFLILVIYQTVRLLDKARNHYQGHNCRTLLTYSVLLDMRNAQVKQRNSI